MTGTRSAPVLCTHVAQQCAVWRGKSAKASVTASPGCSADNGLFDTFAEGEGNKPHCVYYMHAAR